MNKVNTSLTPISVSKNVGKVKEKLLKYENELEAFVLDIYGQHIEYNVYMDKHPIKAFLKNMKRKEINPDIDKVLDNPMLLDFNYNYRLMFRIEGLVNTVNNYINLGRMFAMAEGDIVYLNADDLNRLV